MGKPPENRGFTGGLEVENHLFVKECGKLSKFTEQHRNTWEKIGLALGTILENEIDGIEWVTVIEGRKEYAALRYKQSSLLIKPAELVWGRVKQQQVCNLSKEYECIKQSIEDLEN